MIRTGLHWDQTTETEYVVIHIPATRTLSLLHGACFVATHTIGFMSGLPLPRQAYLWFHDLTEPRLRRACERRPSVLAASRLVPLNDLWAGFLVGSRWQR